MVAMEKYAETLKGDITCKSHHLCEIWTEYNMESKVQHLQCGAHSTDLTNNHTLIY